MPLYYFGNKPSDCHLGAKPIDYLRSVCKGASDSRPQESETERRFRENMYATFAGIGFYRVSQPKPSRGKPAQIKIDFHLDAIE